MALRHLEESLKLLADERLAFLDWEEKLLRDCLSTSSNCSLGLRAFVAEQEDDLAGVVLFGLSETFASINHIAVKDAFRGKGYSSQLLACALEECAGKRVHAMVVQGNREANKFFESQGFVLGGAFLEIDLLEGPGNTDMRNFADLHILGLRACLDVVPQCPNSWVSFKESILATGIRRVHFVTQDNLSGRESGMLRSYGFSSPSGETLWFKDV